MSTAAAPDHSGEGHGHEAHAHSPHLAHHFDTPAQQFSTSKLGIWLFLATEILMFGGLFCAYAVYRSNHPEVYLYAHRALDPFWGMVNTIVLLASSFTMAWGVRAAQMNNNGLLKLMLALTFAGGIVFMCVKGVEYKQKWEHYLFPGKYNAFNATFDKPREDLTPVEVKLGTINYIESHGSGAGGTHGADMHDEHANKTADHGGDAHAEHAVTEPATKAVETSPLDATSRQPTRNASVEPSRSSSTLVELYRTDGNAGQADAATIAPPSMVSTGSNLAVDEKHAGSHYKSYDQLAAGDRSVLNAFFSIYFMMTGLHGVHVVVGMGIMVWLYVKASAGAFSEKYFTPVDLGGLYWHLVDLIWIFLFPLLYLIH
jgi:cytochrome c oxidase subunit III